MSETRERHRIIFVGAQQAGKTTMMCGWYHLAKKTYSAEPVEGYEQTTQLLDTYHRYLESAIVDPTNRGEVTRALFHCRHQHHEFDLELVDYSGEDIVSSSSKFLHGDITADDSQNGLESGFVRDLQSADWILLVHDPKRIAEGTIEQLRDTLWLANALPRLLFSGLAGAVTNATIYLSRGDEVTSETIAQAESSLREAMSRSNLATFPIKCGNAKVWEDAKDREPARRFVEFFTQTMIKVLGRPTQIARPPSVVTKPWNRRAFWSLVIGMLLLIAIVATRGYWPEGQTDKDPAWESLEAEFAELQVRAEPPIDYTNSQSLLTDLGKIEERINSEFPDKRSVLASEIETLRKSLLATSPPQGEEKLTDEIGKIRKIHGPNLATFYSDLQDLAERSRANDGDWEKKARDAWGEIDEFCKQLKNGVPVKLADSSFKGPQWWTSYVGQDDLRLEIWRAKAGDPQPFDRETEERPSLGTDRKEAVRSDNQYSVRWPGAVSGQSVEQDQVLDLALDDQVWVRVFSYAGNNGTLGSISVPRLGPLGLDWFNRAQTLKVGNRTYTLIVRIEADVQVPTAVQNAFTD